MNTLDYILDKITSDESRNNLLDALYTDDSDIDKSAFLGFVRTCLESDASAEVMEYIEALDSESDEYAYFLVKLQDKLISQINKDLGKDYDTIRIACVESFVFWSMYAIAIKKCIGTEHVTDVIEESEYFGANSEPLNRFQTESHRECLRKFNMDAGKFTLKNTQELRMFLHKFGSKNKSIRIRKKNLHRVERRAKKIMQLNKLVHGGKSKSMFSNRKYLVPGQFANIILKLYF